METRQHFIDRIDAFLTKHAMSEREFGIQSVGDNKFVSRVKNPDVGVTLKSIERAEAFMDDYKPATEAATSDAA